MIDSQEPASQQPAASSQPATLSAVDYAELSKIMAYQTFRHIVSKRVMYCKPGGKGKAIKFNLVTRFKERGLVYFEPVEGQPLMYVVHATEEGRAAVLAYGQSSDEGSKGGANG